MGDECPTVAIRDAALLEKLQHMANRILWRDRALEIGCIGRESACHILKCFHVFHIVGTCGMLGCHCHQ